MPKLQIPERYEAGVAAIRQLDLETVKLFRSELDRAAQPQPPEAGFVSPTAAAATAIESLAGQKPGIPDKAEFSKIASALTSMYRVKIVQDATVREFADEVADALEELSNPELRLAHSDRASFIEKLTTLLEADVFEFASKLFDLRNEGEHVYCNSRILTDVRPIFGKEVEQGPAAMVAMHSLKIVYHDSRGRNHQELFLTLDVDDLRDLKKLIERAEAKASTLKAALSGNARLLGID